MTVVNRAGLIQKYLDKDGLLVKSNNRVGDSIQRHCSWMFAVGILFPVNNVIRLSFAKALELYQVPNSWGKYRRHPDPTKPHSAPNVMSRDQTTPLIAALGVHGFKKRLWLMFIRWIIQLGFTTNSRRNGATKENHGQIYKYDHNSKPVRRNYNWKLPDWAPFHLGLYIRALRLWPLYPLLWLLDIDLLLGSLSKVVLGKYKHRLPYEWHRKVTSSADDINHAITILQAKHSMPTPISYLARWVYFKRPLMSEFGKFPENPRYRSKNGIQSALRYYFRPEDGEPPLDLYYKELFDKV